MKFLRKERQPEITDKHAMLRTELEQKLEIMLQECASRDPEAAKVSIDFQGSYYLCRSSPCSVQNGGPGGPSDDSDLDLVGRIITNEDFDKENFIKNFNDMLEEKEGYTEVFRLPEEAMVS